MSDPIQLNAITSMLNLKQGGPTQQAPAVQESGKSFADFVFERLDEVNRLQTEADAGVQRLITGESDNVAEVFAASNRAGIAFDLLMEVRNKLVDAYREVQQMRV